MPFTFGSVFSRFFKLIGENFVLFAVLGLLLTVLPAVAANYGLIATLGVTQATWAAKAYQFSADNWAIGGGISLLLWALSLFNLAMITEIAILRAVDKQIDMRAVIIHSLGNILPIFIVSLITTVLGALLMVLLIVPGLMFFIAASVSVPAYVGEKGVGLWGAVKRSFELTRGHRWLIFFLFFVGGIAISIISGATTRATMGPMFLAAQTGQTPTFDMTFVIVQSVVSGVTALLTQIFVAALYVCLRQSKDKTMPETAAAIFE